MRRFATLGLCAALGAGSLHAQQVSVPGANPAVEGHVGVGYRWRDTAGNDDVYRSMIDLGEGPKLIDFNLSYQPEPGSPSPSFLDFADLRSSSWGGEPASVLAVDWGRRSMYRARLNYRRFDYFNTIPSFANPGTAVGGTSQQTLDVARGLFDADVRIDMNQRVEPFFAVERDSSLGPGRTTFVQEGNEYIVSTRTDNATNTVRGGVRLLFERCRATLEVGGSRFHDDQRTSFQGDDGGNRTALFLGQRLHLAELDGAYSVRGTDRFARVQVEGTPEPTVRLFGSFFFSQPSIEFDYSRANSGNFVVFEAFQFFSAEQAVAGAKTSWPHPSGNAGAVWEPIPGLRLQETLSFDRFHVSGSASNEQTLTGGSVSRGPVKLAETRTRRLESEFARHRFDLIYEFDESISVHGSHGYVWASSLGPESRFSGPGERSYRRHLGGIGVSIRRLDRLDLKADVEFSGGDAIFFQTDRRQYVRARFGGRYRFSEALVLGVSALVWDNTNDTPDVALEQRSRNLSANLTWVPENRSTVLHATYTRSSYSSVTPFLIPQRVTTGLSAYRDLGHTAGLSTRIYPHDRVEVGVGGNLFVSTEDEDGDSETRPTRFYDALAEVSVELAQRVSLQFTWNWYEYVNRSLDFEQFRTHLFTTGFEYGF